MHHDVFGHTRTDVQRMHALITPDTFVPSCVPGWEDNVCHFVISNALGASLNQWFATMEKGTTGKGHTGENSWFIYVLDGSAVVNDEQLTKGAYAYVPPSHDYLVTSTSAQTRLLIFEKKYEPLSTTEPPATYVNSADEVIAEPFMGDPDAMLQTLLPDDDPAFDLAVNIFTYQPGATLPFVETHIMEHGLLMLSGQGVYRLDDQYYPVKAGDVIWMAPWCRQWFVCMGKEPASYIYYKNVNRHPSPS